MLLELGGGGPRATDKHEGKLNLILLCAVCGFTLLSKIHVMVACGKMRTGNILVQFCFHKSCNINGPQGLEFREC